MLSDLPSSFSQARPRPIVRASLRFPPLSSRSPRPFPRPCFRTRRSPLVSLTSQHALALSTQLPPKGNPFPWSVLAIPKSLCLLRFHLEVPLQAFSFPRQNQKWGTWWRYVVFCFGSLFLLAKHPSEGLLHQLFHAPWAVAELLPSRLSIIRAPTRKVPALLTVLAQGPKRLSLDQIYVCWGLWFTHPGIECPWPQSPFLDLSASISQQFLPQATLLFVLITPFAPLGFLSAFFWSHLPLSNFFAPQVAHLNSRSHFSEAALVLAFAYSWFKLSLEV